MHRHRRQKRPTAAHRTVHIQLRSPLLEERHDPLEAHQQEEREQQQQALDSRQRQHQDRHQGHRQGDQQCAPSKN